MNQYDELRSRIAQGWTAMFFCVICGFMNDLIKSAVRDDFGKWVNDPGNFGLQLISVVMAIYIFIPMIVRSAQAMWVRWVLFGLTIFFGLFFVAHQVAHALSATRPLDIIHLFDFSHHALVVWVAVLTSRWARQGVEAPQPQPAMQHAH